MPIDLNELRKPGSNNHDDETNLKAKKLSEFIMNVLGVISSIVALVIGVSVSSWWAGIISFFVTFGLLIFAVEKISGVKM